MSQSESLFQRAKAVIPGGVNSPVRAFNGVGGSPVFIRSAKGAYLYDYDDKQYIDYVGSWGPMILGHNHPKVIAAVQSAIESGLSFGAPTEREILLAEKVCAMMPSIESVRMVSSGTEATMSAIRLARGFTRRDKIIKFEGCYHGHADSLLVQAGSGALTLGEPNSPGVPADFAKHTLVAQFNDLDSVKKLIGEHSGEVAAIIVEPIAGNMNCVPPLPDFLAGLQSLCQENGALLICDEVMTGFRVHPGGAQGIYGIKPDLTTLGKVLGAGMPVGAFGGRKDVMETIAPTGPVYQAGTLSGNPVAMAAGLAALTELEQPGIFDKAVKSTEALCEELPKVAKAAGVNLSINQVGAMFGFFFTDVSSVRHLSEVKACDQERFKKFFHAMLDAGVYLAPSSFEAGFVSCAHSEEDIDNTIKAAAQAFKAIA